MAKAKQQNAVAEGSLFFYPWSKKKEMKILQVFNE